MHERIAALTRSRPPQRTGLLLVATGVLSVGKGTFLATAVVYLLEIARLKPLEATAAWSFWGAASIAVAFPVGALIDRAKGRQVGVVTSLCAALLVPLTAQVHTLWMLMVTLFAGGGFDSAGNVTRRALFASGSGDPVPALAWARTVTNVGFGLGALLSVQLLSIHSASGYRFSYLLVGGVYVIMAVCFAVTPLAVPARTRKGSPAVEKAHSSPDAAGRIQRNFRSGTALAMATAILTIHTTLLTTILPLWITKHTSVALPVLGWLIMLNTIITIGGQISVSRLAVSLPGALGCFKNSAFMLAACCVLLGLVRYAPPIAQICILVAATIAVTFGELFEAAGEWGVSAALADDNDHGFYQSACVVGEASQSAVGPVLVGGLLTALPVFGWPLLIAIIGCGRYIVGRIATPGRKAEVRLAPSTGE